MKSKILLLTIIGLSFLFSCKKDNTTNPGSVTNCTGPVTIGTQTWMCKNLDVDHYRNGDSIPEVRDSATWVNSKTGAWCYYNNSDSLGKIYGKLYNWFAVNDPRGLAPSGWHIPTDMEWKTLEMFLGISQEEVDKTDWRGTNQGGKLKEVGISHWQSYNEGATNESGFSALPGSCQIYIGTCFSLGQCCNWWTASELSSTNAMYRYLFGASAKIYRSDNLKISGYSVRCVKD